MYRRPKFLEILLDIREEMAREADYDADLFAELVRHGSPTVGTKRHALAEPTVNEGDPPARASRLKTRRSR